MKKYWLTFALACSTALTPLAAQAEKLIFGTGNVIIHPINQLIMTPWAEGINAASGGAVDVSLRHGQMLVNGVNAVDRVQDDVVQIAFTMTQFSPGRFPRSLISSMPLLDGSAQAIASAFCDIYEQGLLDEEFAEFQPLFFVPFPQSSVHLNGSPITKMSDIAGKKIMVGSPTAAGVVSALGGTPLSTVLLEHYQSLQRGTADGNIMTFTAFPAFNLTEVTSDHLEVPLGGAMGVVFMDKARFDALPDAVKAALTATSKCEKTREVGAIVDKWEADSRAIVAEAGNTINQIDPAELEALRAQLSETLFKEFADRTPDGEVIVAAWQAALEKARSELGE